MLTKFNLGKSKRSVKTPMITNEADHKAKVSVKASKLTYKSKKNKSNVGINKSKVKVITNPPGYNQKNYPYQNAIGALLYLNLSLIHI